MTSGPPAVGLAREVGAVDGVVAVALGGSTGRGLADDRSDLDLAVYYDPARPFSVAELAALATELDDRHAPEVVGFGDWGPWINGGAWTRIRGTKVDLLWRDLALVDRVLDDCAAGRTTTSYQPGHPHGFRTTTWSRMTPPGRWPPAGPSPRRTRRPCAAPSCAGSSGRLASPSRPRPGRPPGATCSTSAAVCSGRWPAWSRCCSPCRGGGS